MGNRCYLIEQEEYNAKEIAIKIADYIKPEGCKNIFIKPNMVIDPWKGEEEAWIATVTNPSIIEAVLIVLKQKKYVGNITIGDAPMARSRHDRTLKKLDLKKMILKYQSDNVQINLIDIREWYWKYISTMCVSRKRLPGDPKGNTLVNLHLDSAFSDKENKEYEAFDDVQPVNEFHNASDNIFSVSTSILESDMIINLPKLKTHRIAGMTCAMKNLVGINSNKNCVPHNTCGSDKEGGDTCPSNNVNSVDELKGIGGIARRILRKKNPILSYCFVPIKLIYDIIRPSEGKIGYGMWYGNDTIWRSIVDLNRILLYCDKDGNMQNEVQRNYLCISDAIISGEGEGPLHPTPKKTDILIVSDNPVIVDAVAAEIMGFDWKKLPFLRNAFNQDMIWKLIDGDRDSISVSYRNRIFNVEDTTKYMKYRFLPTKGWADHIERIK